MATGIFLYFTYCHILCFHSAVFPFPTAVNVIWMALFIKKKRKIVFCAIHFKIPYIITPSVILGYCDNSDFFQPSKVTAVLFTGRRTKGLRVVTAALSAVTISQSHVYLFCVQREEEDVYRDQTEPMESQSHCCILASLIIDTAALQNPPTIWCIVNNWC